MFYSSTYSLLLATLCGLDVNLDTSVVDFTSSNLGVELELQPLLSKELLGLLRDVCVHTRATNLAKELDNGNLGTETRPYGSLFKSDQSGELLFCPYHLETNDTTANDSHLLGDLLERNGASACDDLLLVDSQAGEGSSLGTGGNENVLSTDGSLAALNEVDCDGVLVLESAGALDVLDVVLLEEELDTLCQAGDGGLLSLHHGGEVELYIADLDTAALGVVEDLVVEMRVVEEGF